MTTTREESGSLPLRAGERALLLRIARCLLIAQAAARAPHPCHRVVGTQTVPEPDRQVPEGWAGNLRDARVVFLSSNPSISLAEPGGPADAVEPYPTASASDEYIAEFLGRRFDQTVRPLPYICQDSRSLMRNGRYAKAIRFWTEIRRRADELLDDADPACNYVMTEVVHCKSRRNVGAAAASGTCARRYLSDILQLTEAPIVVVMGKIAQQVIRDWFPELPQPPDIHPQAELGGRRRTFLFIGQPGTSPE